MDWKKQAIRRDRYRIPNNQQHQNCHDNRTTRKHKQWSNVYQNTVKKKKILFIGLFWGKKSRNNNTILTGEFSIIEKHYYLFIPIYNKYHQNHILLLGDFSAKIGNGETGISNGDHKITPNGKRLINLTNNFSLKVIKKASNAKFKGQE